ncbi:MAG: hypothetical protein KatS3mg039_1008 [Candidatus Kapaibacterium sp.]|nr:MAG: hypothetical protein KatS3mg039_1008 [Candidatus Kapabacteria bacterium]
MPILDVMITTLMKMAAVRVILSVGLMLALSSLAAEAQIMTNNGGTVYLSPRAVMQVSGTYTSVANGQLTAEDSASLSVTGSMHVTSGRATFNGRSIAVVDSNLTTGGVPCTVAYGFLVRAGTGTLTIKGGLTSEGEIQNSATIVVWRDFVNRGTLTNSGTIEVGQP